MSDLRKYECEYYSLMAPERCCLFCVSCTDVFFDYTNGPYMFMCERDGDTDEGMKGTCRLFIDENEAIL